MSTKLKALCVHVEQGKMVFPDVTEMQGKDDPEFLSDFRNHLHSKFYVKTHIVDIEVTKKGELVQNF